MKGAIGWIAHQTWMTFSASLDKVSLRWRPSPLAAKFPAYNSRWSAAQLGRAPYELTVNHKRMRQVKQELSEHIIASKPGGLWGNHEVHHSALSWRRRGRSGVPRH